jgi:chromosome segregation ATPase
MQNTLETTINKLKEKLAAAEAQVANLQKLGPKLEERDKKIDELENTIKKMRNQMDENISSVKGIGDRNETKERDKKIDERDKKLEERDKKIEELENTIKKMRNQMDENISSLKGIGDRNETMQKLQKQLTDANNEIAQLTKLLEKKDNYEQIKEFQQTIAQQAQTIAQQAQRIQELERSINDLEHDDKLLDNLHDEYDKKSKTIKQLEQEITKLNNQVQTLRNTTESQQRTIDAYLNEINQLQGTQNHLEDSHHKLYEAQQQLVTLKQTLSARDNTMNHLRHELEETEKIRDQLMRALNEELHRSSDHVRTPTEIQQVSNIEIQVLENQLANITEKYNDAHEETIKLRNKLNKYESKVEELKREIDRLESLEQEMTTKETELIDLRAMVKRLMDKDRQLSNYESEKTQNFNEGIKKTLQTFQGLLDAKDQTIHRFETQLDQVRQRHMNDKKQSQDEIARLNRKLMSKTDDVVTSMRQAIDTIENQPLPELAAPPGIPIEQVNEMLQQKTNEITEMADKLVTTQNQLQKRIHELEDEISANAKQFSVHLAQQQSRVSIDIILSNNMIV